MKVIFLDLDGVLNSRAYDRKRDWGKQTDIDETRLPLLKEIIDKTSAKIVFSSTWREHWNRDERLCDIDGIYITRTLAKFGLVIYDKTPDLGLFADRKDEINKWLETSPEKIESFVIIDDYRFGWGELSCRLIKTDPVRRLGLEEEHVQKAIQLLNGN